MNVILDTNVFISGIFFSGPPSQILKAWGNQSFHLLHSQEILSEYQRVAEVLASKYPSIDISPIIQLITVHGTLVDTQRFQLSVCEDPDDDKFFECALAGKCKTIISGDKHLLKLTGYKDIVVLSPRDFVEKYL
jgi:putative PIN family toxin of toxin-antitoxin system